jgi:polysaccharide export outer membrane protein
MERGTTARNQVLTLLALLLLCGSLARLANAQTDSSNTQPASKQVDVAKAQPSSTPDTPPQRVTSVAPDAYIIGAEDQLNINVWKEPEMSKQVPVRPDGMISLPLLGDIKAVGYTPLQLQDQITQQLKKFISDPQVTVIVTEVHSLTFNVVGEVEKPGYYPLTRRMTVLDAIALSGGFKDFAKTKKIYVLRAGPNGQQERLPFNYKNVIKGKNSQQNIELQPRDTVVVP